jgi:hypothetical protein
MMFGGPSRDRERRGILNIVQANFVNSSGPVGFRKAFFIKEKSISIQKTKGMSC